MRKQCAVLLIQLNLEALCCYCSITSNNEVLVGVIVGVSEF